MNLLRIIIGYKDIFNDTSYDVIDYLSGIDKAVLIENALIYCSLSTILEPSLENIFYPFFIESNKQTEYYNNLKNKITVIARESKVTPVILNIRSSLNFFELVQNVESTCHINYSETEIKERLLNAYLLINDRNSKEIADFSDQRDINEILLENALSHSLYSKTNLYYLRVAEMVKSCLFLSYCQENFPKHMDAFLENYGLKKWQDYINFVHQIGTLIIERSKEEPLFSINIPKEDKDFEKKVFFFDKFCLNDTYDKDADFTKIKASPVYKDTDSGSYYVIFEQFFVEKMYKGLYFIFNSINDSLKGSENFIKNFRSEIGFNFSEKVLLNRIIKDSIGSKYKHLSYSELTRDGAPDYYIRDGKYVLLFECKDNLVKKEVIENNDFKLFVDELRYLFVENEKRKDKALKQLIHNIVSIRNGEFIEDAGVKCNKSVIYPIIVTHHAIFSLVGLNLLLNDWFFEELEKQGLNKIDVRNLTIININTLILLQDFLPQKNFSLRSLIDSYWIEYQIFTTKKFQTPVDVINERYRVSMSFDDYIEFKLSNVHLPLKKITKYSEYFY